MSYNVKHPDRSTVGICGIKAKLHQDVLAGVNPNSLLAGYLVLKKYKFNTSRYKGAVRNFKTVNRLNKTLRSLKWNH